MKAVANFNKPGSKYPSLEENMSLVPCGETEAKVVLERIWRALEWLFDGVRTMDQRIVCACALPDIDPSSKEYDALSCQQHKHSPHGVTRMYPPCMYKNPAFLAFARNFSELNRSNKQKAQLERE
ncbi:hypothetical protein CBL_02783 [Carabus blaptoides fortunei]